MQLRFFVYALLAAACSAQAQQFQDYEAGPVASPCRIREAPGRESWAFLWSGRCVNGYAQGDGTLRVWRPDAVAAEKGEFSAGYRHGLWETYSRATGGDREITNFLTNYERGTEAKGAKNLGEVRVVRARDMPGWAEHLTSISYGEGKPVRKPAASAPAARAPAAAAPAAAAAAAAALPAISATYKGHLYVVRFNIVDAKGSRGDFMSFVAPDRATAQRLYDEYASGPNSLPQEAKPALLSIDECDGRGAGPYFALAVAHDTRDGSEGGGGWICGAGTPEAAARAALQACKQCQPRPEALVYLLVSTHTTSGSSRVTEMGTFGASSGASTRVWNNYDYAGCLWATGKLDTQGGTASAIHLDCRSYF